MPITSDPDPRDRSRTVYETKVSSTDQDVQSEVRMAKLLHEAGNRVHFTDGVGKADLSVNGILTDVKHLGNATSIRNAITRGKNQRTRPKTSFGGTLR